MADGENHPSVIASVLRSLPPLRPVIESMSAAALAELEDSFEWFGISGGTTLFNEGDVAQDAFILVSGRLGVVADGGFGARLIRQLQPGEFIGEVALVSGEPRSATIVALRDSEVVRIPADAAQRLMATSPELTFYILRLLASRLRTTHRASLAHATKTIAVIPIGDASSHRATGGALHRAFLSLSSRVGLIDSAYAQFTAEAIDAVEKDHDVVLYVGDTPGSAWSRRCLRQADRVIFVAAYQAIPTPQADAEIDYAKRLQRSADLVLVNPENASQPGGATPWVGRIAADHIFHVRAGNAADHAKVARLTTGRGIGLVLSGGGARGFAHIGAIRALHASGIPIDLVGGTSMGALIGAGAALDVDGEEIARRIHSSFVATNPVNDYTLPIVSLSRGRKMARLLRHQYGDASVENLWKVFFCVSSNLSTGKVRVHQQGFLWRALRASAAIPGIVPPCIEQGEVLVDGGIMNNFPANIMSSLARGPVIGIEVTSGTPFFATEGDIEEKSLLWLLRNRRRAVPSIFSVLMRSGTVSSEVQTVASRSNVDLLIKPDLGTIDMMSFDSFDVAVEQGYRATMEAIERMERPLI